MDDGRTCTQLITPQKEGGETKTVAVRSSNFLPPISDRFSKIPHLILGFDTEYQAPPPIASENSEIIKEGWARYEVLSYQFCCSIIYPDSDKTFEWDGIIIPESGTDADRISLRDFVLFALGSGLDQYPDVQIPANIYLTAHFTRADIPAFSDFQIKNNRHKLNLSNIRNSFASINSGIPVKLEDSDTGEEIALKVLLRDTLHLAPAGKRSVAAIGKMLGFCKIKLADSPAKEISIKRNMKQFRDENWPLFREYAIRDAEVCVKYAKDIIRVFDEQSGIFKMPVTLTSIGIDLLKKKWKDSEWDLLALVGKEKIQEKKWNNKQGRYRTNSKPTFISKVYWKIDFVTESYHGGRNEQFWFGPCLKGNWNDYDLTSAYPSAMSLIGMPEWSKIKHISSLEELLSYEPTDLAFGSVEFEFEPTVRFPVFPVRTQNGIIFPLKGESTAAIPEILLAHKLGAKLKFIEGVFVPTDKDVRIFEGFIKDCIENRNKEAKGTVKNLFWKELSNSTYGKTAQGLRERRIYDLKAEDTKRLEPSEITNPFFASFITSFCRATLGEILNNLPKKVCVFSVTTDGFLTNANDRQIERATKGVLCKHYKKARKRLTPQKSEIYETKHKVRQPLGWRTRGQATLIPAADEDWGAIGSEKIDEDTNYVLAKGGIKIKDAFEKTEQNHEVVKMFLKRKPTDEINIDIFVGIRDMYVYGNDLVDRTLTRKLSMEFDWKRQPHYANNVYVEFDDIKQKHLFFSTRPWQSLEEFIKIRELWEKYIEHDRKCLKTLEDYDAFASYADTHLSLTDENSKWLHKADGDLKRFAMDFCRAWRHRKAGTHTVKPHIRDGRQIFPTYKLRHQMIVDILGEAGVLCKKGDVENSRNKEFEPNRVPNTEKTRLAMYHLRDNVFPELDIDQFLAKPSSLSIKSVDLAECPYGTEMLK